MIGLALLLAPAAALAQAAYPAALDAQTLSAWLVEAAGLSPQQVVAVSPSTATAVVARHAGPDGRRALVLRALALTPETAARSGVAAWDVRLEIDCRSGQVRLGATTGYAGPRPDGDGVALAPAEPAWRRPKPGSVLEAAWRSACQPDFRPPLAKTPVRAATPSPAPAAPAFGREAAASAPGRVAVQVVSSPAEADTRRALAALKGEIQGLQTRIEPAQVRGRRVYRGMVAGFVSRAEAQGFCHRLKAVGRDCLVR